MWIWIYVEVKLILALSLLHHLCQHQRRCPTSLLNNTNRYFHIQVRHHAAHTNLFIITAHSIWTFKPDSLCKVYSLPCLQPASLIKLLAGFKASIKFYLNLPDPLLPRVKIEVAFLRQFLCQTPLDYCFLKWLPVHREITSSTVFSKLHFSAVISL